MGRELHPESEVVEESPVDEIASREESGLDNLAEEAAAEEVTIEEAKEPESVEESVRAAIKEQKLKNEGSEGKDGAEPSGGDSQKPNVKTKDQGKEVEEEEEVVASPFGLDKKGRELFSKIPKEFKPEVSRFFREKEALFTRTQQELNSAIKESRHILEAVRPYYVSKPELAKAQITEAGLVAALIGSHQKLSDPETDLAEIMDIAAARGYHIKAFDESGREIDASSPRQSKRSLSADPEFRTLQENTNSVLSYIRQQALESASRPILEQLRAVRDEKDASGALVYPELQKPGFIQYAKPLVSEKRRTNPSLSHSEAMKEVIRDFREEMGYSPSVSQAKLPVGNNSANRAAAPAVTVRGRLAPTTTSQKVSSEPRKGETMEESVRAAIEELKRGMIN